MVHICILVTEIRSKLQQNIQLKSSMAKLTPSQRAGILNWGIQGQKVKKLLFMGWQCGSSNLWGHYFLLWTLLKKSDIAHYSTCRLVI